MAGAVPQSQPKGKGLLGKLNPKQKRMLVVAGVALALALVYLLSRRRPTEGEAQREPSEGEGIAGQVGGPVGYAGGENASALSQLGENLGGQFGVLAEQGGDTQQMVGEGNAETMGLRQEFGEFAGSQGEANERWLGSQNEQSATLKQIQKKLEHSSPHSHQKSGGGRKATGDNGGRRTGGGNPGGKKKKGGGRKIGIGPARPVSHPSPAPRPRPAPRPSPGGGGRKKRR